MTENGIDGIPFDHPDMDVWRDSLRRGITYLLPNTPLLITGGVDDVWVNPAGELYIVDYKATAKNGEVSLDADWQIGYKRQVEIYQWLFRKNNFKVSNTAYFVYCNGNKERSTFDARLDFSITVLPYEGNTEWIEPCLTQLLQLLRSSTIPAAAERCEHCAYRARAAKVEVWDNESR